MEKIRAGATLLVMGKTSSARKLRLLYLPLEKIPRDLFRQDTVNCKPLTVGLIPSGFINPAFILFPFSARRRPSAQEMDFQPPWLQLEEKPPIRRQDANQTDAAKPDIVFTVYCRRRRAKLLYKYFFCPGTNEKCIDYFGQ